jgi:hypothetical protein
MLTSSIHIPERLLQLVGAATLTAFAAALLSGIKAGLSGEQARDVPLATTHPAVPTNLFSSTYERENLPALRVHQSNRWLFTYGDKLCHSILSLLLYISHGAKLPDLDPQAGREVFSLYFQAALAETRLAMDREGVSARSGDAMLDCVSRTIFDTPLAQLSRYDSFLRLSELQRLDLVGSEATQRMAAPAWVETHFRAAYILLRTMMVLLAMESPKS